jgi:hypothetical protein
MSCAWGAMSKSGSLAFVLQGGDERRGVACWEPKLVVDRRSEAPQRTFDPMLVEVCLRLGSLAVGAAAPTSLGVLEARESPVLPGPDEPRLDVEDCGMLEADNGTTSASGPGPEDVLQPAAEDMEEPSAHSTVVTVDDEVAQVVTPSAQPATAATLIGSGTVPTASLQNFIASLKLPLEEPLIASSPRRRVSRLDDSVFVPRRSDRLAAKSIHRDPNPEKQASLSTSGDASRRTGR